MHMAFSASHSSQCLKRHVGAVIADENGQLISVGYNENPRGTNPCVHEPRYDYRCFRDIVRDHHFQTIARLGARCPTCGAALPENLTSPWHCPTCSTAGRKTNLELTYFPDRAMNWCTAIHAEAWALLDAGPRAKGAILYTTTFPCFQCAEKIVQAGIVKVIYTEPYPDLYSEKRLLLSGITLSRFEGVRSSSRSFGGHCPRKRSPWGIGSSWCRSHQQRTEFCCRILVHVRQDVRVTSIVIDTFTCPEPAR